MAKKSMVAKQKRKAKFSTREYSRCRICGRPHAYLRKYGIKYGADKNEKIITGLKRISKPGLRVYAGAEELPKVLGGLGIAIISTNKGLLTDKEARKQNVGGEVLAFVW